MTKFSDILRFPKWYDTQKLECWFKSNRFFNLKIEIVKNWLKFVKKAAMYVDFLLQT